MGERRAVGCNLVPEDRERRAREVWLLRVTRCWSYERIGEHVGVHATTAMRMCHRVEARLAKEFEARALAVKVRQTCQLEYLASEALSAWERSKLGQDVHRVTSGRAELDRGGRVVALPDEEVRELRTAAGAVGCLAEARAALGEIRRIWGLDAPEKQELTGAGGADLVVKVLSGVSFADL